MINNKYKLKLGSIVVATTLLSGCYVDKDKIVSVGDAENMLFTDSGRLIVSGGEGIYEVTSVNGSYDTTPLYPENQCQFTGIAQHGDWLFAVCSEGLFKSSLLVAQEQETINFEKLTDLSGFIIANGIDFSPQGDLLLANYNILSWPRLGVTKLPVHHDVLAASDGEVPDADRVLGSLQHGWLAGNPNGVRVSGNRLFTTEGGSVFRHELNALGEVVDRTLLSHRNSILDDLYPLCGGAIVTDFLAGNVYYVDANGYEDPNYQTGALSIAGPSSVTIPKGNGFASNQLLVTAKGILQETESSIGNKVWALNLPFNIRAMEAECN